MKSKILIAAMLLLCVMVAEAQILDSSFKSYTLERFCNLPKNKPTGRDTIPVVLLVCDTNMKYRVFAGNVFWVKAFSVRKIEYKNVNVSVNPNTSIDLPSGGYGTTLLAWNPRFEERPFYSHLEYLDEKKLPLSKTIIVWQSVSK